MQLNHHQQQICQLEATFWERRSVGRWFTDWGSTTVTTWLFWPHSWPWHPAIMGQLTTLRQPGVLYKQLHKANVPPRPDAHEMGIKHSFFKSNQTVRRSCRFRIFQNLWTKTCYTPQPLLPLFLLQKGWVEPNSEMVILPFILLSFCWRMRGELFKGSNKKWHREMCKSLKEVKETDGNCKILGKHQWALNTYKS